MPLTGFVAHTDMVKALTKMSQLCHDCAAGTLPVGASVSMTARSAYALVGSSDSRRSLASSTPLAAFDPWSGGHTIALPLACRTIAEADGRIDALADTCAAVAVTLPLAEYPA